MLQHKEEPWSWQNRTLLREETGVEARFYVLHRDGTPFANIMLVETNGAALLGHVWTEPRDRGTGASSLLMDHAQRDFAARVGKAIFLGTEFESAPWHYYRRRGFTPVEDGSGYMAWYVASRDEFERAWFGSGAAIVEPLAWPHWPAAAPLFLGEAGGVARLTASPLFGRASSEGPLLPLLREQTRCSAPTTAAVLRDESSAAVLGLACRLPHPIWPATDTLDLFCHSRWWHRAAELLAAVNGEAPGCTVAYCDASQPEKREALESFGFRETARLPRWLKPAPTHAPSIDVSIFLRE